MPRPPERLAQRLDEVIGEPVDGSRHGGTGEAVACIDAAEALLRDLLAQPTAGRESALDLLTVDALATYAFEAASEAPDTIPDRAADAMRRFAAIGRR
jgi:hypothetical protein